MSNLIQKRPTPMDVQISIFDDLTSSFCLYEWVCQSTCWYRQWYDKSN